MSDISPPSPTSARISLKKNIVIYGVIGLFFFIALFNVYSLFEKRRQATLDREAERVAQLEKLKTKNAEKERKAQLEHEIQMQGLALEKDRKQAELLDKKLKHQQKLERYEQLKQARRLAKDNQRLERRIQSAREHKYVPEGLPRKMRNGIESATYLTIRNNPKDYIGNYQPNSILKADKLTSGGANGLMLFAMLSSDLKAIEEVIGIGHDVNQSNKSGYTPLMFASAYNQPETIKFLIDKEANLTTKEYLTEGNALHVAARFNPQPDVIDTLIKNGFDIESKDKNGNTALLVAAQYNQNLEVVERLVELGADITVRNNDGKGAYGYVYERTAKRGTLGGYEFISDEYQKSVHEKLKLFEEEN